jgi:hypothetical protein
MAGKYSVIIFAEIDGHTFKEVRRINAHDLESAKSVFRHQHDNLRWSQQHKINMGLDKAGHGIVQLFDHREGFELREEGF